MDGGQKPKWFSEKRVGYVTVIFYFKGMPNSIGFYKRIFLHVITARINYISMIIFMMMTSSFKFLGRCMFVYPVANAFYILSIIASITSILARDG